MPASRPNATQDDGRCELMSSERTMHIQVGKYLDMRATYTICMSEWGKVYSCIFLPYHVDVSLFV